MSKYKVLRYKNDYEFQIVARHKIELLKEYSWLIRFNPEISKECNRILDELENMGVTYVISSSYNE